MFGEDKHKQILNQSLNCSTQKDGSRMKLELDFM